MNKRCASINNFGWWGNDKTKPLKIQINQFADITTTPQIRSPVSAFPYKNYQNRIDFAYAKNFYDGKSFRLSALEENQKAIAATIWKQ